MEPTRADIVQRKLVEERFDIESMNFKDFHWIYFDSIKTVILSKKFLQEHKISSEEEIQIRLYLDAVESYLNEFISNEDLKSYVIEAWKEHDKSEGIYKNILRAVICAMGSMEDAVKNDGADFLLGFMFSYVGKIGEKYCEMFRKHIEQHPKMQKYKN